MEPVQVTISLLDIIVAVVAFVIGWFLGQYWVRHSMGQKSVQERLLELANNSRAADKLEDLSPQVKAYINDYINKLPKA